LIKVEKYDLSRKFTHIESLNFMLINGLGRNDDLMIGGDG
jgi:hypothetical protein